jgi:hypothetical protein
MAGLSIILDGITLQHAGELLLDSPSSQVFRSDCRLTYVQSLEDYAFASFFGERILVSGSLPEVKGDRPGAMLSTLNQRIAPIERGKTAPSVADLIQRPDFREAVLADLEKLPDAYAIARAAWDEFFIREVETYLGEDGSLQARRIPRQQYKFAQNVQGVPRKEYHLQDAELQRLIPANFVSGVVSMLRRHGSLRGASQPALEEFVSRTALTHTALYWWYEDVGREQLMDNGARLPFVTRATLRQAEGHRYADVIAELRDMLLPHALAHALSNAQNDRGQLIRRLTEMWSDAPYPYLRGRLSKVVGSLAAGDIKGAGKLAREIRRYRQDSPARAMEDSPKLKVKVDKIGPSVEIETGTSVFKRMLVPNRTLLRRWVGRFAIACYVAQLRSCFPELYIGR